MEVTALCMQLVIVLMLQQHCYSAENAALRIVPNRLQLFEYESISCDCEGFDDFTEWRVMRRIMGAETTCSPDWETSRRPCFIKHAFESDSGEYWCEAEGTGRSSSVNISVTAGSVILEVPALPVMEGEDVSLLCRSKTKSSVLVADFYKDGAPAETGYKGSMTINSVSKSDEGLYKCKIIGGGESAESWLTVRGPPPAPNREGEAPIVHQVKNNVTNLVQTKTEPKETDQEEAPFLDTRFPRVFTPLWMIVTIVPGALLLLLVGGLYHMKQQANDESCSTTAYYTLSMGPEEGLSPSPLCKYQPTSK